MSRTTSLLLGAALAAAALPAAASAAVLDTVTAPTPVAAFHGTVAWSQYDAAAKHYTLVVSTDGAPPRPLGVAPSPTAFDVDLGTSRTGALYAVYTRDGDIYRARVATGAEQRIATLSSPTARESQPTILRGEIAFIRRERGRDQLRIGNTTSGTHGSRSLLSVPAGEGVGLGDPELSWDRIAYVRSARGVKAVHVRFLRGSRDRTVYTARSGGANFANVTRPSVSADLKSFVFARTNTGSGTGNRVVRYTIATGRLAYAQGSPHWFSTGFADGALGLATLSDATNTGTCFANVQDGPDRTECRVETTGPLSFTLKP